MKYSLHVARSALALLGLLLSGALNAQASAVSIGNRVWVDENGDGVQDVGEPGIAGVGLKIKATGVEIDTTTNAYGGYLVKAPAGVDYTVEVDTGTLPAGVSQTLHPVNNGADFGNQDIPYAPDFSATMENVTADFGFVWGDPHGNTGMGAIGDRVWIDTDANGRQDLGEIGLDGIELTIYADTNGDDVVEPGIDTPFLAAIDHNGDTGTGATTTKPDGTFIFHGIPAGVYVVSVNMTPTGYVQSGDPDHYAFDAASAPAGTAGDDMTTVPVLLAPGDVYLNVDFGYQPDTAPANNVGDRVYLDANGNGMEDLGEPGIAYVSVSMLDSTDTPVSTTLTDSSGAYNFNGVPDGSYAILIDDTNNVLGELVQSADPDGTLDNRTNFTLAAGGGNNNNDFGYAPPMHDNGDGLIGDLVFHDRNGNAAFDPGEGLERVLVELYDLNDVLIKSTFTDENGNYSFGDLSALATFEVRVDIDFLTGDMFVSVDPDGTFDGRSIVIFSDSPVDLNLDFGYQAEFASTLGDQIWLDTNADGVFDGAAGPDGIPGNDDDEPGLEGITLDLYIEHEYNEAVGPSDPRVGSTVTDTDGIYAFSDLPPNDYVVDVTDERQRLHGYWHSLGADSDDGFSKPDPYAASVDEEEDLTLDFGYYLELAALGNFVWNDTDGNGRQDSIEPGVGDVGVRLDVNYQDGNSATMTTLSNADGFYAFRNLLSDEDHTGDGVGDEPMFQISVGSPGGAVPTTVDAPGTTDFDDSDDHSGVIAAPRKGTTDVAARGNPNDESVAASYDFGFQLLECQLSVDKTCIVPKSKPGPFDCKDAKPIDSISMIWNGSHNVDVKAWKGNSNSSVLLDMVNDVTPGQVITVSGYSGSKNDVRWEVFDAANGRKIGESEFHLSCSDKDMNGPEDCSKPAGNGKRNDSLLNDWLFEGLAGNDQVLDCNPHVSDPNGTDECTLVEQDFPSCDSTGKPDYLTWKYTGGGCNATDHDQGPGKVECSGNIDGNLPVLVEDDDNNTFFVTPGEEFTTMRKSSKKFALTGSGGTEHLEIHVSCSQPLQAEDVYGSLTLKALDGQEAAGSEVTFRYQVTNTGPDLANVIVDDDKLGLVAGPSSLPANTTQVFEQQTELLVTTKNKVTVTGDFLGGTVSCVAMDTVEVTVIPGNSGNGKGSGKGSGKKGGKGKGSGKKGGKGKGSGKKGGKGKGSGKKGGKGSG